MSEYIDKSDALDILDQFEDAVENGEGGFFYSKAREMMRNLPTEEIIHCKDCEHWKLNYYDEVETCFEHRNVDGTEQATKPYDFCSWARLKE